MSKIKPLNNQSNKESMEKEVEEITEDIIKKLNYLNDKYNIAYIFSITKGSNIDAKYSSILGGPSCHITLLSKIIDIQINNQMHPGVINS